MFFRSVQVAVGSVEAAEEAFQISVEVAQHPLACHEWCDQATALIDGGRALGPVAQLHGARALRLIQPGCHGLQQCLCGFTARQQRCGELASGLTVRWLQHQQHTLRAQQLGQLFDKKFVQPGFTL